MLRLSKITAVPSRRTRLLRTRLAAHLSSQRSFASDSREDKPFTKEFNRLIRNQKADRDIDESPTKPPVDWSADQSFFPGARLAVENKAKKTLPFSVPPDSDLLAPPVANKSLPFSVPEPAGTKKTLPFSVETNAAASAEDNAVETTASEEEEGQEVLEAADEFDPPEKPSHGQLQTVYVKDEHTLESKGIRSGMKPHSPEDDPLDKSVQWEDFTRDEMYQLLKHMDSWKGQTFKHGNRYMNAYAIYEDAINKADMPYLHHIQTVNEREIGAASDDDLDLMITENRKLRLETDSMVTYDQFLDQLKLTEKYPEEELEAERARYHKENDERLRLLRLREPPLLPARAYMLATRKKAIWNIKDPRLDDLIPPANAGQYTYQDWEHELRRNALQQYLNSSALPPIAERALTLKWEESKKPSVLGPPEILSKYVDLGSTLKPLKEFHQKMLRIYGAHYELGEPRPPVPIDDQLEAGLSAAIMTATDWVEPDKSGVLQALEAERASREASVTEDLSGLEEDSKLAAKQLENREKEVEGESEAEGEEAAPSLDADNDAVNGEGFDKAMARGMARDDEEDERESEFRKKEDQVRKSEATRLKTRWKKGYKEPKTIAAYMKLLTELEAPGKADINFANMTQSLNLMGKNPSPQHALGNEADLEPEMKDDTEYPPRPKDKAKIKDHHEFPVKLDDWEKLKFETKQHDAMPEELQTFFNPQLRRHNEEERTMMQNLDPGMGFISSYTPIPSPYPQPRVFHLDSDVKEAIWRFNRMDPRKYHSRKLAAMFGLSIVRVQSVLRLQYLEEQIAQEIGYDSELEIFENEVEEEYEVTPAQWDPEYFNELKLKGGNFSGNQEYVDEGDFAILKRVERQRVSRYWNEYEMDIVLEQNSRKHAYGAMENPLPPPVQLSSQKTQKQRYPVVMTEIADRRNGNFRIAVRDKHGVLREPDDAEFKRVRRRERGGKDYFNHVPYQFGETI